MISKTISLSFAPLQAQLQLPMYAPMELDTVNMHMQLTLLSIIALACITDAMINYFVNV